MRDFRETIKSTPQVTIGMPVFNNARTLERALDSVRAQSFADWRLIITDDGSSDNTFEIALAAAKSDPRIEVRKNEDRKVFGNFSVSLLDAETPYFVWLAGDDYWHADFLKSTVAAMEAAPNAVSAIPEAAFIGDTEASVPNLGFLAGTAAERVKRFLAHPGGTRMYGLMRTEVACASFPKSAVNAYDWYLMVALLAQGPQLSVPGRLLFREETGWIDYAQMADELTDRWLYRQFPVLETSLMLLRDRKLPLRALPALIGLNVRKHEEYLAVNRPEIFLKRIGLFRRFGLPISERAEKLSTLADWHRGEGKSEKITSAFDAAAKTATRQPAAPVVHRVTSPDVTAILTCRNVETTLSAWLDHAETLGCNVVLVDHGSTDSTKKIAASRQGDLVSKIVDVPFHGYFDLTAQLELKRDIINGLRSDWILHADADEFLLPPKDLKLGGILRDAERDGRIAIPCDEHLYLPRFEDEMHDPTAFRQTMTSHIIMQEHDEKQRIFHRSAPLDVWFATGGHTVTREPAKIARQKLILAHYLGLSLDDLRAQYLSRVFAPRDTFKLWHGNRMASHSFAITEPAPELFEDRDQPAVLRSLPIFQPFKAETEVPKGPVDLVVVAMSPEEVELIRPKLKEVMPGLRCHIATTWSKIDRSTPVLSLLSHPARIHELGLARSEERDRAVAWTRKVAGMRQIALERETPFAEIRLEDIQDGSVDVVGCIRSLFVGPLSAGVKGFVKPKKEAIALKPYEAPVRTITQALAADLGYC